MVNKKTNETNNINNNGIDVQALIEEAVKKANLESEKQYQNEINELKEKLNDKKEKNDEVKDINSNKMIKIMHMSPGSAVFEKGRINVKFEKLFDERRIKFEILDEMYYAFKSWFDNFEIVILDKEVREHFGIEYLFKEHGADKIRFHEILKFNNIEMLKEVDKFSKVVAWAFLKFFLEEYINGNSECMKDNKFNEVQNYYESKYNITHLQETVSELIGNK